MPKKVLFIDRDGTIIIEPPVTFQIDSLEQMSFLPNAISALKTISNNSDYELVMVTNQDGLGTEAYPEETFQKVQNKMLEILAGEGIYFSEIHIDRSFEYEGKETRKPGIGMLSKYFSEEYDLNNSFVIGDRATDVQLAKNLGCKSIFIQNKLHSPELMDDVMFITNDWFLIADFLFLQERIVTHVRNTNETKIEIELKLDGEGEYEINTGLNFFDHMLEQLSRHGDLDLKMHVEGDLQIDEHHTIEDTAIALGEAILKALGDKRGIERYAFVLPMDDCLAQVAIDFGGRPWLVWEADFKREKVGDMPTEMFYHFFKSFSETAKCNLNIKAEGENEHHKIESIFKAFAKVIRMASRRNPGNMKLPSTKGVL
jgi:imidazoleglycerol-phosphate dehydratase/histidinol-phosphatase